MLLTSSRLCLYLVYLTFPFYLYPSGGAQLSTACVLGMFVFLMRAGPTKFGVTRQMGAHMMFVGWTLAVNGVWYLSTDRADILSHVMVGAFTGLTFFSVAALAQGFTQRNVQALLLCVLVSIVGQLLILSLGLGRESYRAIAFFNNPNQLSYFAALCSATALILGHLYRVSGPVVPLIVITAVPVSVFSMSRGGTLACVLYLILMLLFSNALSGLKRVLLLGVLVGGMIYGAEPFMESPTFEKFGKRLDEQSIEKEAEGEGGRGYARIVDFPDHLIWGVGEGYYERFNEQLELHTYPGTILFSYGLIGLFLMIRFLWVSIPDVRTMIYLLPVLLYNLTHHGGRSLILWALLGLVAAASARREQTGARRSRHGSGSRNPSRRRRHSGPAAS